MYQILLSGLFHILFWSMPYRFSLPPISFPQYFVLIYHENQVTLLFGKLLGNTIKHMLHDRNDIETLGICYLG